MTRNQRWMELIFQNPALSSSEVHVLGYLVTHNPQDYISIRTIAAETGISPNTVCTAIKRLTTTGYITKVVVPGPESGSFDRHEYQVHHDRLEKQ